MLRRGVDGEIPTRRRRDALASHIGVSVGNSPLSGLQAEIWLFPVAISGLAAAMLHFQLPVTLWDVTSSLVELGTTKIWV